MLGHTSNAIWGNLDYQSSLQSPFGDNTALGSGVETKVIAGGWYHSRVAIQKEDCSGRTVESVSSVLNCKIRINVGRYCKVIFIHIKCKMMRSRRLFIVN